MIFLFPDNTGDSHGHNLPAWATLANAALMLYWQHRPWGCSFVRRSYDTHTLTESQLCRPAPSAASTASACHPGYVAVPLVIRCDKWVCSYVFFHCCHLLMTCVWSVESECWHTRHRTGHHLHIYISQCLSIYVFIATIHSVFYSFLFDLFFSFVWCSTWWQIAFRSSYIELMHHGPTWSLRMHVWTVHPHYALVSPTSFWIMAHDTAVSYSFITNVYIERLCQTCRPLADLLHSTFVCYTPHLDMPSFAYHCTWWLAVHMSCA